MTEMSKYAIGVDYGTLSGRALLVDCETGEELASSVFNYPHAVMDEELPSGKKLGHDWALQDPGDYLEVLSRTIPDVLEKSHVSPDDIIGIGRDRRGLFPCEARAIGARQFALHRVFVDVGGEDGVGGDAKLRQKFLPARAA